MWTDPVTDTEGRFPDVTVREDVSPGVQILRLSARDEDGGSDGEVRYDIQSATSSE